MRFLADLAADKKKFSNIPIIITFYSLRNKSRKILTKVIYKNNSFLKYIYEFYKKELVKKKNIL